MKMLFREMYGVCRDLWRGEWEYLHPSLCSNLYCSSLISMSLRFMSLRIESLCWRYSLRSLREERKRRLERKPKPEAPADSLLCCDQFSSRVTQLVGDDRLRLDLALQ